MTVPRFILEKQKQIQDYKAQNMNRKIIKTNKSDKHIQNFSKSHILRGMHVKGRLHMYAIMNCNAWDLMTMNMNHFRSIYNSNKLLKMSKK